MDLQDIKIILVVVLCVPIAVLGIQFVGSLLDNALAGRKKKSMTRRFLGKRRGK
jgi:hypothetical protein